MCEDSRLAQCVPASKVELKFPLRQSPEAEGKFPYRNSEYYATEGTGDEKAKTKTSRLGFVAQRSVDYLESTGRKLNLENVPWFKAAHGGGKR